MMTEIFAQGDLLIERVADVEPSGTVIAPDATGVYAMLSEAHGAANCSAYLPTSSKRCVQMARSKMRIQPCEAGYPGSAPA